MDDWKTRLVDEYHELKNRYEKLKAYNNKQEVKRNTKSEFAKEEHYRYCLMRDQQRAMGEYLHILELRAELENIPLYLSALSSRGGISIPEKR